MLGDEKVLERLRRGRLFKAGRLTDELLAIAPHFAPLETTEVGADPQRAWVIVENWTTYNAVAWVARRCDWSGTVLWGVGRRLLAERDLAELLE